MSRASDRAQFAGEQYEDIMLSEDLDYDYYRIETELIVYTDLNFKTAKALRDAVAAGQNIGVYSPGPFPCPKDGIIYLEGPHYPQPHRWYLKAEVKHGVIVRILK